LSIRYPAFLLDFINRTTIIPQSFPLPHLFFNHTIISKMKSSIFMSALVSALSASAASVQINATTSYLVDLPYETYKILTVSLYDLNTFSDLSVSRLTLVQNQAIPADVIECRAYKDTKGLEGSSLPFSGKTSADLSTNLIEIKGILCYATKPISSYV
jgi:hypothetical protein